ncbi:hypothetical protein ISCGN_000674 [Ixodes scapularis]
MLARSCEQHNRTPVSVSSRRSNMWLPKLPWTARLGSDLQHNRRLPHPSPLLGRRQGRDWRKHHTFMTSSGGNKEFTFLDAVSHRQSSLFSGDFPLQQVRGHPRSPLVSSSAFLHLAAWLGERNNRRRQYRV